MSGKKLPNINKLTPEKDKEFRQLALSLGMFQRRDKKGNLMWQQGPVKCIGIEEINGKKMKRMRRTQIPLLVNHYLNLTEIWKKDGQNGIDHYVKFFRDLAEEEEKKKIEDQKPKIISL